MKKYRPSKGDIAVFLEFHNTGDIARRYAKDKLASGTAPITPEAVAHMRHEIAQRKLAQEAADRLAAEDKAEREAARAK